jgi:hypothetical protein
MRLMVLGSIAVYFVLINTQVALFFMYIPASFLYGIGAATFLGCSCLVFSGFLVVFGVHKVIRIYMVPCLYICFWFSSAGFVSYTNLSRIKFADSKKKKLFRSYL